MNTLISIIIPLYNKASSIKETVLSVLSQDYTDFEIVIVDDGSTDNGPDIVKSFQDNRIRLISQENQGVSKARNKGIEEAIGDWLLFLDADDKLGKDCLSVLWNLHLKYPTVKICAANYKIQFPKNKIIIGCSYQQVGIINDPFKLRWYKVWNLRLGAFIVQKASLSTTIRFHPIICKGEDTYFTDTLLESFQVAYTPIPIMLYDREYSSLSNIHHDYTKNISSYLSISVTNKYHQLLNAEIIGKGIILSLLNKRWSTTSFLIKKNIRYAYLIIWSLFLRIISKLNCNLYAKISF